MSFTFGHVRQLDAVASRFLINPAGQAPALSPAAGSDYVFVDVDDTTLEVHGHKKQGSGFGYSGARGLNALLATVTTPDSAPVVVAQRLRRGSCGSPRGAGRLIADAIATTRRLPGLKEQKIVMRADSAYYGHPSISAALNAGADVSVTARMSAPVKRTFGKKTEDVIMDERRRERILQNAGKYVIRVGHEHLVPRADGRCGLIDLVENALHSFLVPPTT